MVLYRAVTETSPASAPAAPRRMSDPGEVRRMFPVHYTPKRGE